MMNLATVWIKIYTVPSAHMNLVAKQVELAWLTRYPLPSKVIEDRKNKFLAELKTIIKVNCCIKVKPITSRDPEAKSIRKGFIKQ